MALAYLTAEFDQLLEDVLGLDALCYDLQVKSPADRNHGFDDLGFPRLACHRIDEGAVDFYHVKVQRPQLIEAGIASAEIVERDAHAEISQRLERGLGLIDFLDDGGLGQFQHEALGWKAELRS